MKIASKKLLLLSLITTFVAAQALAQQIKPDEAKRIALNQAYGKLPLSFEANQGQTDPRVKFLSRGNGYSLFLTPTEAVLVLKKTTRDNNAHPGVLPSQAINDQHKTSPSSSPATVLRMKLVGGNATAKIAGTGELPGKSNYLIGNDPKQWRTNLSNYTKVEYRDVYPGVDLVYYGNQRQLEHDFVIAPGADPKAIRLAFQGARKISLNSAGDLVLDTKEGEVQLKQLRVYQKVNGQEQKIAARYLLKGKRRVAFEVAEYDRRQPLVIDPVLSYSTYLGGSSDDYGGSGIALDASGDAYVTGVTQSTNFPTTSGAFQTTYGGGIEDGFVTKLNSTGSALVYSTYLGGNSYDTGDGIAVDASGNAYVTGYTDSSNFPTTSGAFQTTGVGAPYTWYAFVTKLNPTGSALIYSTYLGGSSNLDTSGFNGGNGIALDASGDAYVTGVAQSTNFPTTSGAFQTTNGGYVNAFVTELNPTGSALVYSTYLGGNYGDQGLGIAVDASGNAYVTGVAQSTNFPTTSGAFQTTYGGGIEDGFVTKLNSTGSALVYSTYLGGSSDDYGSGIALDASGDAYVTGQTNSTNFPTTSGAFQTTNGGGYDAFVTKLNPTGSALVYSTYLGGSSDEYGSGIALDASGDAYVTGQTNSTNFPTTSGAFQTTNGGVYNAFVTELNSTGSALVYSTYLGGNSNDGGFGIALDASGTYVTGQTNSTNFPTTSGAFQTTNGGGYDVFVAKLSAPYTPPVITVTDAAGNPVPCGGVKTVSNNGQCGAVTVPLTITASGNCPGTITVASTRSDGHLVADPYPVGSTTVTSTATDACSNTTTCVFTVTVTNNRTITSNFNGTPIPGNSYLWFNAVLKPSGLNGTNGPVTFRFIDQTITSGNFNLHPPDTTVIFDPNAACASTVVTNTGQWIITAPKSGLSGNTFLSGLSYQVPAAGLPGGINPVSWSGTFTTDTAGVGLNWQWAAAVYTTFNANNGVLGAKATDDNQHDCTYHNSDHAGTPEQYKSSVVGGARGGGGSNYTGGLSGTESISPCDTF